VRRIPPAYQLVAPNGQVAQLVEQRTENPCVAGSIPALATKSLSRGIQVRPVRPPKPPFSL
jgi:hypothetical protein